MNTYSIADRVFIVEAMILSGGNPTEAARKWTTTFGKRPKPDRNIWIRTLERFKTTGSVANNIEAMKTAARTVRTPEIIQEVSDAMDENPQLSTRQIRRDFNMSQKSASRILRIDLGLFPYKIQTAQRLEERDEQARLDFANDVIDLTDRKKLDLNKIIFTDEAHFYLDGYVNSQNYRIWGSEKPNNALQSAPLHPQKVTVWCGISSSGLIGPIFLRKKETVDRDVYRRILTEAFNEAEAKTLTGDHYWQQDGASCHCTQENLEFIRSVFGDRVISRRYPEIFDSGIAWPARSPDLSPCDFFLWGNCKDKVYRDRPKTLEELKRKIERVMSEIPRAQCAATIANFEKRLRVIIAREGGYVMH